MNYKGFIFRLKRYTTKKLEPFNLYKKLAQRYINKLNKKEYHDMLNSPYFGILTEKAVEYRFVFEQMLELQPKKVLDIGTGTVALPHILADCMCEVIATDNIRDYWRDGLFNRHWLVQDSDITKEVISDDFDVVTCISTLEHIEKFDEAVKNIFNSLKSGGYLILTFPYNEEKYVDNVYILPDSIVGKAKKYKTHSYSRKELDKWCENNNAKIIKQEYWQLFTGKVWTTGERLKFPKQVTKDEPHQHSNILIKKL